MTHVVECKDLTASFMHTKFRWDLKAARTLIAADMTPEQTLLARQVSVSWEKGDCHYLSQTLDGAGQSSSLFCAFPWSSF